MGGAETNIATASPSPRDGLLSRALALEWFSIVWCVSSGAWSIAAGVLAGSLGVVGLGLNLVADLAGSVGLVWRFRVERRDPGRAHGAEARSSLIVATGLLVVAVFLVTEAIRALAVESVPGESVSAMVSAGAAAVVLAPLGIAKYRVGTALHSHALKGDGTLSSIGAALGALALLGLLVDRLFGWWWADRVAALMAGSVAAIEGARVLRKRPRPTRHDPDGTAVG